MSQGTMLVDTYRSEGIRRVKLVFTDIDGGHAGQIHQSG